MGEAGQRRAPEDVCADERDRDQQGAYEPPAITVLGSLADLTLGNSEEVTDGTFGGSVLR